MIDSKCYLVIIIVLLEHTFSILYFSLFSLGITIKILVPPTVDVNAAVLLGSTDLQGKAYLLNKIQHNGKSGCVRRERKAIGNTISILYISPFSLGITIKVNQVPPTVDAKAAVLLGSTDLQGKAHLLYMTQHNGESGCVTCEEK